MAPSGMPADATAQNSVGHSLLWSIPPSPAPYEIAGANLQLNLQASDPSIPSIPAINSATAAPAQQENGVARGTAPQVSSAAEAAFAAGTAAWAAEASAAAAGAGGIRRDETYGGLGGNGT